MNKETIIKARLYDLLFNANICQETVVKISDTLYINEDNYDEYVRLISNLEELELEQKQKKIKEIDKESNLDLNNEKIKVNIFKETKFILTDDNFQTVYNELLEIKKEIDKDL